MYKSLNDRFQKRNALYVLILFLSVAFSSSADVNVTVSFNFSGFDAFKTSSDVSSNMNIECVRRFAPIISTLSPDCQSRIVTTFKENKVSGRCCVPSTFVKSVRDCLRHDVNLFAKSMTGITQSNKKSFSCFRRRHDNQHGKNSNKQETDREDNYIRSLLLGYNNHTHLLSKCLVGLSMNTLHVLSRMCLANSTLPKFFRQDSNGNFVFPLRRMEDDLNLYKSCGAYLKSHVNVSNTFQDSYLEKVNTLMGEDRCNYFSDFFSFDLENDRNDPFFPTSLVPTQAPGSLQTVLANWFTCATTNAKFDYTLITALNATVYNSQNNTNGLSTSVGRSEINLDYLKSVFYLERHSSFHVTCKGTNCTALCSGCSSLNWNSSNVVLDSSIRSFDYSCCNNTCVVAIVQSNGFSASEVFVVNGDNWSRRVDNLLVEKLRNAQTCFNHRRTANQTTNSTNTTNSTRNNTNVQFNDNRFVSAISDIQSNPNNYNVDFRLGVALNLNVRPYSNNTQVSLLSFLAQDLYARNENFFLSCENGQCTYQCRNCNRSGLTFSLLPNTTNNSALVNNVNSTVQPTNGASTPSKRKQLKSNREAGKKEHNDNNNAGSIFLGYLSNSNYPHSTSRTNQQIPMRYNLYSRIHNELSDYPRFRRNSTRNITYSSLGTRTLRPSYYSLYRSSDRYLPSWGFYRNYYIPQFQFDSFRATFSGVSHSKNGHNGARSNGTHGGHTNNGTAHTSSNVTVHIHTSSNRTVHNHTSSNGTVHTHTSSNVTVHNHTSSNRTVHNHTSSNGTVHNHTSSNRTNTTHSNQTQLKRTTGFVEMDSTSRNNTNNNTQRNNNTHGNQTHGNNTQRNNNTHGNQTHGNNTHGNQTHGNNTHRNQTHGNQTHGNQTHGNQTHGNHTHRNQTHGNHTHGNHTQGNHTQGNHTHGNHTHGNNTNRPHFLKNNTNSSHGQQKHSGNKNTVDVSASYNPLDWMPSFRAPFDIQSYMNNINQKLNQVRIYVECCRLFCVSYIESFDDGVSQLGNARRVFVDVNLRNYFGLDATNLPAQQKTCLVNSLYSNTSNLGWVQSCQIEAPFTTFPLKESCRTSMNRQCGTVGLNNVFRTFDGKCENSQVCDNVNDNSTESEKLNCGSQISSRFLTNNYQVHYEALVNPCSRQPAPAKSRLVSLIQTHFMKKVLQLTNSTNTTNSTSTNATRTNTTTVNVTTSSNTTTTLNGTTNTNTSFTSNVTSTNTSTNNSSSLYVNEANLSPAERNELNSTKTAVNADGSITVSIDSNTNLAPNTNVEADLNLIKSVNNTSSKGSFSKLSGLLILVLTILFI